MGASVASEGLGKVAKGLGKVGKLWLQLHICMSVIIDIPRSVIISVEVSLHLEKKIKRGVTGRPA